MARLKRTHPPAVYLLSVDPTVESELLPLVHPHLCVVELAVQEHGGRPSLELPCRHAAGWAGGAQLSGQNKLMNGPIIHVGATARSLLLL